MEDDVSLYLLYNNKDTVPGKQNGRVWFVEYNLFRGQLNTSCEKENMLNMNSHMNMYTYVQIWFS